MSDQGNHETTLTEVTVTVFEQFVSQEKGYEYFIQLYGPSGMCLLAKRLTDLEAVQLLKRELRLKAAGHN
jgi:hypothetical protein